MREIELLNVDEMYSPNSDGLIRFITDEGFYYDEELSYSMDEKVFKDDTGRYFSIDRYQYKVHTLTKVFLKEVKLNK